MPIVRMAGRTLLALVSSVPFAAAVSAAADPDVASRLEEITSERLLARVDALVAIGTRRSDQPGGEAAQRHVEDALSALPLDEVIVQDFDAGSDNVIGILRGTSDPERIHVLGAHYDSIGDAGPSGPAPGADDNASGVAALLEAARALSLGGARPAETIAFAAFAAEELGRKGSEAYVRKLQEEEADVSEMVCLDVIGYVHPGTRPDLSVSSSRFTPGIDALIDVIAGVAETYLPEWPFEGGRGCG